MIAYVVSYDDLRQMFCFVLCCYNNGFDLVLPMYKAWLGLATHLFRNSLSTLIHLTVLSMSIGIGLWRLMFVVRTIVRIHSLLSSNIEHSYLVWANMNQLSYVRTNSPDLFKALARILPAF
jgi:hypothetical protein